MLKQHPKILSYTAQVLDLLTLTSAFFLSFPLRAFLVDSAPYSNPIEIRNFLWLLALYLFVWWSLLKWQEVYGPQRLGSLRSLVIKIFRSTVLATFGLLGFIYLVKWNQVPRSLVVIISFLGLSGLTVEKYLWFAFLHYLRRKGKGYTDVLIVGATEIAKRFLDSVSQFSDWGVQVLGFLVREGNSKTFLGVPVLGTFRDMPAILHRYPVDEVVFALPIRELDDVKEAMDICEVEGVKIRIISNFFSGTVFKAEADVIHGIPIISYSPAAGKGWQLLAKRTIDILVSSVGLVLLSPLFATIALAVKLSSPGPVFYRWRVVGLNKKPFTGYKFRTMVENADEIKEKLLDQNEMNGPVFKLRNDPRVTRIGRFLRKYSLDELPQLWSVLKGDMSLVGPRPPLESELHRFQDWHRRKLSVKPGITCLWQINGRNDIYDFDEWVRMDLEYIDKWSLWLDFKIMLKTIPAVISGRGAY